MAGAFNFTSISGSIFIKKQILCQYRSLSVCPNFNLNLDLIYSEKSLLNYLQLYILFAFASYVKNNFSISGFNFKINCKKYVNVWKMWYFVQILCRSDEYAEEHVQKLLQ